MSSHSITDRLANARSYCAAQTEYRQQRQEEQQRQKQVVREQKPREKMKSRPQEKARPRQDYLYIISASNGYYKIGISFDPHERFKTLQREAATWAIKLELIHIIASNKAYTLEQTLHKRFAKQRVMGEWFLLTTCDIEWLRAH